MSKKRNFNRGSGSSVVLLVLVMSNLRPSCLSVDEGDNETKSLFRRVGPFAIGCRVPRWVGCVGRGDRRRRREAVRRRRRSGFPSRMRTSKLTFGQIMARFEELDGKEAQVSGLGTPQPTQRSSSPSHERKCQTCPRAARGQRRVSYDAGTPTDVSAAAPKELNRRRPPPRSSPRLLGTPAARAAAGVLRAEVESRAGQWGVCRRIRDESTSLRRQLATRRRRRAVRPAKRCATATTDATRAVSIHLPRPFPPPPPLRFVTCVSPHRPRRPVLS